MAIRAFRRTLMLCNPVVKMFADAELTFYFCLEITLKRLHRILNYSIHILKETLKRQDRKREMRENCPLFLTRKNKSKQRCSEFLF